MDQASNLRKMIRMESSRMRGRKGGGRPRVMTVSSGKGGVGKTNVVVNLGIAFQRMGKRVLIFDADLGLANIDIIFGLHPRHTIEEIINGEKELSQIVLKGPEDVAIIPASSGVQALSHLTEGQKLNLLNEFDGLSSAFDILLIDTGAGISSNVIYFNLAAEERVIVLTPEPTSVTDAYALVKVLFSQHGIKDFTLLFNMVRGEGEARAVFENLSRVVARFMGAVSLDYAGFIPVDRLLQEAVSRRSPVLCAYPEALSSRAFRALARSLMEQTERRPADGSIKFLWKRLMAGG